MIKVLLVSSDNDYSSGAFLCLVELCKQLIKQGEYEPLVVLPVKGNGQKLLDDNKIRWCYVRSHHWIVGLDEYKMLKTRIRTSIKMVLNLFAISRLEKIIKEENIQLIHINSIWSYVGAETAIRMKIPFIWHIREALDLDQKKWIYSDKGFELIGKSSGIIYVSEFLKKHFDKFIPDKNSAVIYDGVETLRFYNPRNKTENDKNAEFLVVGNMNGNKGQEIVIDALSVLIQKGIEDFHVTFVGDGKYADDYKKMSMQKGLSSYVTFVGNQKNVSKYYNNADVFIMSSYAEAFGRVTIEAMLSGCYVIGMNSGATSELINNNETGELFAYMNSDDLAAKMENYINNQDRAFSVACNGQKNAMEKYTSEKNALEIEKMYQQLVY